MDGVGVRKELDGAARGWLDFVRGLPLASAEMPFGAKQPRCTTAHKIIFYVPLGGTDYILCTDYCQISKLTVRLQYRSTVMRTYFNIFGRNPGFAQRYIHYTGYPDFVL